MPCFSCLDDDFCVVSQPFGCIFVSFMLFRDMMFYSKRSQENVNEPCGDSVSVVVFDSLFRAQPSTRKDDDDEDYIHDFCCCFAFHIQRKVEGEKKGPSSSPGPMFAPLTLNKRTYRHRSLSHSCQSLRSSVKISFCERGIERMRKSASQTNETRRRMKRRTCQSSRSLAAKSTRTMSLETGMSWCFLDPSSLCFPFSSISLLNIVKS